MRVYRMVVPLLMLAISAPAAAQNEVPAVFRNLQPYQIIEAVAAERQTLNLTEVQEQQLDSLRLAIRAEPHRYKAARAPGKAHRNVRMQPMISGQRAYADALAVLTPAQRARARDRFSDAQYQLPPELQRAQADPSGAPLRQHAPDGAPTQQSTSAADSTKDPLLHRGGETPPDMDADSTKPSDPVTHQR